MLEYKQENEHIIVHCIEDFDLEETLTCGQCFRYKKISSNKYLVIANNQIQIIEQIEYQLIFENLTIENFETFWKVYFDLDRNYGNIKKVLSLNDVIIQEASKFKPGIRLLKQEVFECMISFIISQNKQIPHIMQVIENISQKYGEFLGEFDGQKIYSFPTVERLSEATEQDIRDCKAGFRAPYIVDACQKILSGQVDLVRIHELSTKEAKDMLMSIKGIGNKIADCILLFSLARYEVFPTDVWIKRVMAYCYPEKCKNVKDIESFSQTQYGEYAGFAQQYLFDYGRRLKLGK